MSKPISFFYHDYRHIIDADAGIFQLSTKAGKKKGTPLT